MGVGLWRVLALFLASALVARNSTAQLVPTIITFGDLAVDVGNNDYVLTLFKADYPPYGRDFVNHRATERFYNSKLATDITANTLGFTAYQLAYLSPQASGKNLLIRANFSFTASGYDDKTTVLNHAIPLSQQFQYYKEYQSKLANIAGSQKAVPILKDALYLVSASNNDFLQNYYVNPFLYKVYTPNQNSPYLTNIFTSFIEVWLAKKNVNFSLLGFHFLINYQDLYGYGARRIEVTSLPPLDCLPATKTPRVFYPLLQGVELTPVIRGVFTPCYRGGSPQK